jgi:hypothetical protein
MASIRISSPSGAAALVLADLLSEHGATAMHEGGGNWQIVVPLDGAAGATVPQTLSVARQWLDQCGLDAASVRLDGHTHLLRSSKPANLTMH